MNLIVYGSLLNKKELKKEGISLVDVELVRIFGYRRIFNQEPSYRFVDSINRAVLNVIEDKNFYFNAIVIKNINENYFKVLDEREKGYKRTLLDDVSVQSYNNYFLKDCYIYLGKKEKENFTIFPNQEYLNICLEGVKSFGKEFYKEFRQTTYKNLDKNFVLI